ncbi:MAG: BtpA/SgcQ family protein [Ignavibacteriaceae bacterium]
MKHLNLFNIYKPVIGMIHVSALPGTPNYRGSVKQIIEQAKTEALIYKENGIDAIAIENMHDVPYLKRKVGPEITSLMSVIGYEVKNLTKLSCGIQILAGANKEALAAAHSAGLDFVRTEGFVFAHIADEGLMESDAGELLRYRKQIAAENILIFTDIKKKHSSHSITSDVDIIETAKAVQFFLSDGIIITGSSTGSEADIDEVKKVKDEIKVPVIIGSGIATENIDKYLPLADAFIVGSSLKKEGNWMNEVDVERVKALMKRVNELKSNL